MSIISFEEIIKFQQETKLEMILSQIDVSELAAILRKTGEHKARRAMSQQH
ncbi:hypothetical protein [Alkaliphilus sp. B6464]|uniref:hypothetical protein n=1 Tax=Alkaliphilus sp. B6464 TaxID=2731219 RepID=UPI001BA53C3E|nr:hypothetical protein [Alkaliphilus sp. B6464]QUH19531.1 hypothetical protein HYG84_06265 [Alkaliphilus sp. B6464]